MTGKFETLELDECAIDAYSGKLANMRVPTPDAPLDACIAMDILDSLARATKSNPPQGSSVDSSAQVIQFPVRT